METRKREFIEFMLASKVLLFGDFTTKSGRKSPYFINTGRYVNGEQLGRLGDFYADAIADAFGDRIDNLFGPAYKGIPLATVTAASYHRRHGKALTYTFNRKEAKDHGEGGKLVGYDYPVEGGKTRVLIVEDVTTAGTSVRETFELLKDRPHAEIVGLIASVDRMERGTGSQSSQSALQELAEAHGIQTVALIDLNDLMRYLEERIDREDDSFTAELLERMHSYRKTYGVG